jgi:putative transposase
LIEPAHPDLSVLRQCQLLALPRSSYYYEAQGESEYNHWLMRLLDEQYTKTPFYGSPRMTAWLQQQGHSVNHKRVERLMSGMGLQAIYPKPNLSKPTPGHRLYPYLLRDVKIERADQVWSCDITYIRMQSGFVYLMAVIDWFSRYVLSWSLSLSLEVDFCLEALEAALGRGKPQVFNTDQGSQFTSDAFTGRLQRAGIAISMDGRGRALDNIFVERLWRTVKYEEVYLHSYESVRQAKERLGAYLRFYNEERLHQSLGYRTPAASYAAR